MGFAVFNIFFFITGALFIQVMQVRRGGIGPLPQPRAASQPWQGRGQ